MTLCLFLLSGKTFTFREVKIVQDNESVLVFEYVAMSDGKRKRMTARKDALVGHSTTR